MAGVRVRVAFNRFPAAAAATPQVLGKVVDESATRIEQQVKQTAPYETGNLRRSYHKKKTGPLTAEVGNDAGIAPYAVFVEYGTSRMGAQPHLRPAAEAERPRFQQAAREAVAKLGR